MSKKRAKNQNNDQIRKEDALKGLIWDLQDLAELIVDYKNITIEQLREQNKTKAQLLKDLREVLVFAEQNVIDSIRKIVPHESLAVLANEVLVTVKSIIITIRDSLSDIDLNESDDQKYSLYARFVKAFERANDHRPMLERLSCELEEVEDQQYDDVSNAGKVSEVKTAAKPKDNIESFTDETIKYDNIFRPDGERWLIRFKGKQRSLNKCKGLEYIHILIKNKGKEYSVQDLLSEHSKRPIKFDGADDLYDEQALAEYKKKVKELDNDIEKAKKDGDSSNAERLEMERSEIINLLSQTWHKDIKKLNLESERFRKSIGRAITRAINKTQKQLPELGKHLKDSIPSHYSGVSLSYHPSEEIEWVL